MCTTLAPTNVVFKWAKSIFEIPQRYGSTAAKNRAQSQTRDRGCGAQWRRYFQTNVLLSRCRRNDDKDDGFDDDNDDDDDDYRGGSR